MKKIQTCILTAASVLVALPAMAGGVKEGTFTLSPLIGGYSFDGVQHTDTTFMGGIRGGYNFTKYLGAEIGFDAGRAEGTISHFRENVFRYGGDLLVHLLPDSNVVPYLAAGYGAITLDRESAETKGIFDYGVGLKAFITENLALRADLRHLIFNNNDTLYNYQYLFGISYQFGGAAPVVKAEAKPEPKPEPKPAPAPKPVEAAKPMAAPAAPVLDSDGDGVPDNLDKCPSTPQGVKVDKNGCPLDTDGDGVYDYLDKCPDTPKGVAVDKDGCPLDSDGDGVYDYLDKCPDTPKGLKVDKDGCPMFEKHSISLAIQFDTGKSDIKAKYHDELKKVGDFLKQYPETKGVIEGHTDNVGKKDANMKLSQRRADSVRNYIIKKFNIAPDRLTAKGYGPTKPLADNSTAAGRQKNRRIVASIDSVETPVRK